MLSISTIFVWLDPIERSKLFFLSSCESVSQPCQNRNRQSHKTITIIIHCCSRWKEETLIGARREEKKRTTVSDGRVF